MRCSGGGLYLASAYVPFVGYSPRYCGILGTAILVLFVALVWYWTRWRPSLSGSVRAVSDLRMVGYYFFEQLEDVTKALISTMVCG